MATTEVLATSLSAFALIARSKERNPVVRVVTGIILPVVGLVLIALMPRKWA